MHINVNGSSKGWSLSTFLATMGGQFSAGPFLVPVQPLVGLELDTLYTRRMAFLRYCKEVADEGAFFMSQAHFSRTFRLKGDNAVKAYRLLDPLGKGQITATDVFSALALTAPSKMDLKLKWIAGLFDYDRDG